MEEKEKSYVVVPEEKPVKPPVVTPEGYIVKQPRPFKRPPGRPKKGSLPPLSGQQLVDKKYAISVNRVREIMRREGLLGREMPVSDRLRVTTTIYDEQIQHSASLLATESYDEITLNPEEMELRRIRVQYVKDLLLLREKINTLAEKIDEAGSRPVIADVYDEATDLISKADQKLNLRLGGAVDGDE